MGPVVGVEAVVGVFILYFCFAVVKETGFVVLAGCCCELVQMFVSMPMEMLRRS